MATLLVPIGNARRAAALYLPLALAAIVNPPRRHAVAALTGNLVCHIVGAIPGPLLAGAAAVRLGRGLPLDGPRRWRCSGSGSATTSGVPTRWSG